MKCPYCDEDVRDGVLQCRHCGRGIKELPPLTTLVGPPPPEDVDEDNGIHVHLAFASPAEALPAGDALIEAGWDEVTLHVVLDAYASGPSEKLQRLHDNFKTLDLRTLSRSRADADAPEGGDSASTQE